MSKMFRRTNQGWYALRFQVLERDNFTCQYCGRSAPEVILHVDHILSVMDGGSDDPVNLHTCCAECNQGKSGLRLRASFTPHQTLPQTYHNYQPHAHPETLRSRALIALQSKPAIVGELSQSLNVSEASLRITLWRMQRANLVTRIGKLWTLVKNGL